MHHLLLIPESHHIMAIQTPFPATVILGENILEVLRSEPAFAVERHTIAAMFVLVVPIHLDPQVGIGQPRRTRRVRQVDIDDKGREDAEVRVPAKAPASEVSVQGRDDAVAVRVEVIAVLDDGLVRVLVGVVVLGRTVRVGL